MFHDIITYILCSTEYILIVLFGIFTINSCLCVLIMHGMGDACDDAESNDTCSCMVMLILEETAILVKSKRNEYCCGQMLVRCMSNEGSLYRE